MQIIYSIFVGLGALLYKFQAPTSIGYSMSTACLPSQNQAEAAFACAHLWDLREATLADLLLIPGVGDNLGQRILAHREDILVMGETEGLQAALESIRGIGPKTAEMLRGYLTIKSSKQ